MEKREKKKDIIIFGIVMAISLSVALNIGNIFGGVGTFIKIVNPILLGCMIAIILNVPMEALSRENVGKGEVLKEGKDTKWYKSCYIYSRCCAYIWGYYMDDYSGAYRVSVSIY